MVFPNDFLEYPFQEQKVIYSYNALSSRGKFLMNVGAKMLLLLFNQTTQREDLVLS